MEEKKKRCTKCKANKPLSEYSFDITNGNYRSHCKECIRKKRKEYREKNKEAVIKYNVAYIARDPERWRKYQSEYYLNVRKPKLTTP